nr:hypothetical protein [Tanacetum cinerariifolium]
MAQKLMETRLLSENVASLGMEVEEYMIMVVRVVVAQKLEGSFVVVLSKKIAETTKRCNKVEKKKPYSAHCAMQRFVSLANTAEAVINVLTGSIIIVGG